MPVDEAPEDEGVRQTYNFAPGYHGLIYRADAPDHGGGTADGDEDGANKQSVEAEEANTTQDILAEGSDTKYKLQAMRWGRIAFSSRLSVRLS
jgi:hypothetical protein